MDSINELLINAISKSDCNTINYCLQNGACINKICSSGFTPLGCAAQTGNLHLLRMLLPENSAHKERHNQVDDNENSSNRPIFLHLDKQDYQSRRKNIGYFVVHKDMQDNDLDEGPTPDGMEALEWDMEITDENVDEEVATPEISIYKWYAKILNQTSIALRPPELDLSRLDMHGLTVLHYAVKFGSKEMVEFLLRVAPDLSVNQTDTNWNSPLHLASIRGELEIGAFLLKNGANVNAINCKRETPLHFAAQNGHLLMVQLLCENAANVDSYDMEDRSPLGWAVCNCHEEVAEFLIKIGTQLNREEFSGYTVLYNAVWNNLFETAKSLLEAGAKITQSHYLLHMAIRHNNLELVKLLHRHGAFLNVRDEHGNTALMTACINKTFDIADYLLINGASVNSMNQINGMTALHLCVQGTQDLQLFEKFLQLLISYRVDLDANSYQGNVLFYSIVLGHLDVSKVLVKYGVDVNRRDEHAYFDNLSLAKKQGDFELVKTIVFAGFEYRHLMFHIETLKACEHDEIYKFLLNFKRSPLNLRELCRIVIRKKLKYNVIQKIYQLPLPSIILRYLALDIL